MSKQHQHEMTKVQVNEMCGCICHNDGVVYKHAFPCCDYVHRKRSEHHLEIDVEIDVYA